MYKNKLPLSEALRLARRCKTNQDIFKLSMIREIAMLTKNAYQLTWLEFATKILRIVGDPHPELVYDAWISHVTQALKEGKYVSKRVLKSTKEIYWIDNEPHYTDYWYKLQERLKDAE